MPADRTKPSRRGEGDAQELVWTSPTSPVEPCGGMTIELAPIITPISFAAPETQPERKGVHAKKKPENHVPRPPNAFILFRSSFIKSQHVSTEVETNHSTLSKIIGMTWRDLPEEERQVWHAKAKTALDEHKRKFPEYAFRPAHAGGKGGTAKEKRKVREVGPKDLKRCKKIAELLVEGLKGQELDAAIQEFDKHHIPEFVTRFDTPITERAFQRRSSSVPLPDGSDKSGQEPTKPASGKRSLKIKTSGTKDRPQSPASEPPSSPQQSFDEHPASPLIIESVAVTEQPAFDFNSFSFEDVSSPVPMTPTDPLSMNSPLSDVYPSPAIEGHYSPFTSPYDPSFIDSWSQSASSSPEALPTSDDNSQYFSNFYDTMSMKGPYNGDAMYVDPVSTFNPPLAHVDLDLASFLTIPQYSM